MKAFTSLTFQSKVICFVTFLILPTQLLSQRISAIVMEGAGVRGIAYAGGIKYLEENNLLSNVKKVGGTSAGAIAALALCLNYSAEEIENIISATKIQKFNDGKFFFIGGISRLNRKYGWYRGKAFTKWLEDLIIKKTGNGDITFQELHESGFRDLYVTGTCLNHQNLLVFSYETFPEMKLKDAVRISMSIPLYFEAVIIDTTGHVINRKQATSEHHIVVDGGFTGNFPIGLFDEAGYGNGASTRIPNHGTIGMRIDSPEQIRYDSLQKGLAPVPIHRFRNFVGAFYNYVIENLNREKLIPEDWERTVSISSGDVGPKIRRLSPQEKKMLITNGYLAMKAFFNQHPSFQN